MRSLSLLCHDRHGALAVSRRGRTSTYGKRPVGWHHAIVSRERGLSRSHREHGNVLHSLDRRPLTMYSEGDFRVCSIHKVPTARYTRFRAVLVVKPLPELNCMVEKLLTGNRNPHRLHARTNPDHKAKLMHTDRPEILQFRWGRAYKFLGQ